MQQSVPVLLTGRCGVGKTSFMEHVFASKHPYLKIVMSTSLPSATFYNIVIDHLGDSKESASRHPGANKLKHRQIFFLDDLHLAGSHKGQSTTEQYREMLSTRSVYDRKRHVRQSIEGSYFVAAATAPAIPGQKMGSGHKVLSGRLLRLMINLNMFSLNDHSLHTVYGKALLNWLEEFPTYTINHHMELSQVY